MYAEAGSSPFPRPPALAGTSSPTDSRAAFSVAPEVSYSRVEGIPWVRSGSSDKGICFSGVSATLSPAVSDGLAALASAPFGGCGAFVDCEEVDGGVEEGLLARCWGSGDLEVALPNLDGGGLLSLAIPLLHIEGAAVKAGRGRRVWTAAAHLDTAAGWARRRAALESMMTDKNQSWVLLRSPVQ